jgi:molybdopterin/thiamine biosynthesis adenylyltransferase
MRHLYVQEQQLRSLLQESFNEYDRSIAFGWKGEDVFHLYTFPPKVAPTGYPTAAFVRQIYSKSEFDDCVHDFRQRVQSFAKDTASEHAKLIGLYLFLGEEKLHQRAFLAQGIEIHSLDVRFIPQRSELYSRSQGLLESDVLENKNVLIIGMGSFGSHIAVELAKAGIGKFQLVDFDRLELSNISRHFCGVNDLGRYKTHAIRDAIWLKNPFAEISTYEVDMNAEPDLIGRLIESSDLVLCATDNNQSRFTISEMASTHEKRVIFGRAITRAEGGDVFVQKSSVKPCYGCLIGGENATVVADEEISSVKQADEVLPAYTSPEDKMAAVQVGLSSDIWPMCNMMVKLSLNFLSDGTGAGLESVNHELTYDYYFWANRRERHYGNFAPFNQSRGLPTILKWYGVNIPPHPDCYLCSS